MSVNLRAVCFSINTRSCCHSRVAYSQSLALSLILAYVVGMIEGRDVAKVSRLTTSSANGGYHVE